MPPSEAFPAIGPLYKQRGFGPEADIVVQKVQEISHIGIFVFFRYFNDRPFPAPQCVSLAVFNSLFYPAEPLPCTTPPPGNFSSRISWLKRLFSFTGPRVSS